MQRNKSLETVLAIVLGLLVAYWFKRAGILLWIAVLTGVGGLVAPPFAQGVHWLWSGLSRVMGVVSGSILLTLAYVLVLLPLSLLSRLFGKPALRLRPGGETYFKERNHTYINEDIIHPW